MAEPQPRGTLWNSTGPRETSEGSTRRSMEPCTWGGIIPWSAQMGSSALRITTGARLKKLKRCTLIASKANHVLGYIKRATAGQSWEAIISPNSVFVRLHTEYYIQAAQLKRVVKTVSRGLQWLLQGVLRDVGFFSLARRWLRSNLISCQLKFAGELQRWQSWTNAPQQHWMA